MLTTAHNENYMVLSRLIETVTALRSSLKSSGLRVSVFYLFSLQAN
jgi:hypothetical protein